MHQYGQYCPVARAAEILADRWTLLIIRELLADIKHFNELERGLPGMSRMLLVERLRRLERTGVLERRGALRGKPTEYRLTTAGRELQRIIDDLGQWSARWAFGQPRPSELDPIVLLWWMRRRVALENIPRRRVLIEFHFRNVQKQYYWLLIEPTDISVCLKHPGFDIDLTVIADILAFIGSGSVMRPCPMPCAETRSAWKAPRQIFVRFRSGSPGARWRLPFARRWPTGVGPRVAQPDAATGSTRKGNV